MKTAKKVNVFFGTANSCFKTKVPVFEKKLKKKHYGGCALEWGEKIKNLQLIFGS